MTGDLQRTKNDPVLRRLMVLITLAVVLGATGTVASVLSAQWTQAASEADVRRAADLTRELARDRALAEQHTYLVRQDTRALLYAICRQIETVARQAPNVQPVEPCPSLPPVPEPVPASPALAD